jgi:peptide/nickel transport system substrate-binding protein
VRKPPVVAVVVCLASLALAACGGGNDEPTKESAKKQRGGSLTVLEETSFAGAWPTGLDPATNTNGAANQSYMTSIFGTLFQMGANGKITPELASGYEFADGGRTVRLKIRQGVKFSDGAPFDAATVAWHIKRVLKSDCTCSPGRLWPGPVKVSAEGTDTVVLSFPVPYAAVINSFVASNANWVASRQSLERMGERAFRIKPVGAGPFKVVSNKLSSELVLERNPTYWKKGRPYLDRIVFKSIGGDQEAWQAMQAGQADAYEGVSVPTLVQLMEKDKRFKVTPSESTSPYNIQLNTDIAPFNDKRAREAIYYATDSEAIRTHLFKNMYPTSQSFTGPGGLWHQPKVPGYRTHDVTKAKALVQELGGLEVELGTINVLVAKQTIQALQSQWQQAGIKVKIRSFDLQPMIQHFQTKKWQAMLQTAGSYDPAGGVGVTFRFGSTSPFSGVHDKKLDKMLADAAGTLDQDERGRMYNEIGKYMSDQAYSPFLFAFAPANVARKGVSAPGLTTPLPAVVVNPPVLWDEASVSGGGAT